MSGSRQLIFQCGPEAPKGWAPPPVGFNPWALPSHHKHSCTYVSLCQEAPNKNGTGRWACLAVIMSNDDWLRAGCLYLFVASLLLEKQFLCHLSRYLWVGKKASILLIYHNCSSLNTYLLQMPKFLPGEFSWASLPYKVVAEDPTMITKLKQE